MKKLGIAVVTLAFVLTLAGCSSGKKAVDELAQDYPGYIHDKLGVDEGDLDEIDASTLQPAFAFEGSYYYINNGDYPSADCRVYDNADEAREEFETYYDAFNEAFDEASVDGEYECCLGDDYGYIVVDGSFPGVAIFGNRARTDSGFYAGVYYSGNTVVAVIPRNDLTGSDVENVISRLGLPMANGQNT